MSYNSDIATYKAQIDNDISTQSLPNSIPPDVVGSGYTDLADLLAPYINSINNNAILSGVGVPSALIGNDLDVYYNTQPTYFELYRKESGAWVLKVTVPFGINLPDGPATLRTFIDGTTASVTKGGWFINNAVYNKLTQTIFTVPAADATFSRTDLIYADTSNQILYLTGTPSLTPVDPTLPANTIAVDYVLVPSVASGFDPYLRFGSTTEQNGLSVQNDTGALTYGGISVASGTTVNIGACTGYVVNNETTPGDSTMVFVNYAGETGKTVTTLGSGIATYVLLNSLGVIVFQNTFPTSAQRKTHIYLSKIGHPAGTITTAGDEVDFVLSPLAQHRDLFQAITYVNNGVAPSSAGATLNFQLSTGTITGDGINFVADNTNPNNYTVAPQPTASFLPRTQTGAGGGFTSTVDVANYDVAGTITAIPGGANTSTLQYIYYVPPLGLIVQYGQTTYPSLTDAIAAVGRETFTIYPSLIRNAILVGVLAVIKSATALNNTSQARFFLADKFGSIGGSSAGVSTATLQSSYDNSLQPQITTTTALGAVQFKRGSAADTDNVFQVLNAAGTANFSVTGEGRVGIGVTNSSIAIDISGTSFAATQIRSSASSNTDYPVYTLRRARAGNTAVAVGDVLGNLSFRGHDGTSFSPDIATIAAHADETHTTIAKGTRFSISTTLNGTTTPFVSLILKNTGNLLLQNGGTFTDTGERLQVNGVIKAFAGAEALKVGTNTGNPDHAYIGLYARTATPTTRSGYLGYASVATTSLTLKNEITNGALILNTIGSGFVMGSTNYIQLSVTDSANTNTARIRLGDTGTTSSNIIYSESFFTSHANGSELRLINGGGTISAVTAIASGNSLGLLQLGGYTTSSAQYNSLAIKGVATEAWSSTAGGSKLDFYTTPNGTVTQTLAMTISQNSGVDKVQVNGTITAYNITRLQQSIAALDINFNGGGKQYKTIAADSTFTMSNTGDGKELTVIVINSAGAGSLIAITGVTWLGSPTLTIGAGKVAKINLETVNAITYGTLVQN